MRTAIIGTGNVATHLAKALEKEGAVGVNSRNLEGMPEECDLAIISVKDDAIAEVAQKLMGRAKIIAHTSGSVPADALKGCSERYGVFYPMQPFTKGVTMDYSEIPFFIEGSDTATEEALTSLALMISPNVRKAGSSARKRLHLSAVFACNFTNCLMGIADELLKESGMDYTVMLPLLKQTVGKLYGTSPAMAQTGPAARGDLKTIEAHLAMLSDKPHLQDIYLALTKRILDSNLKAGKLTIADFPKDKKSADFPTDINNPE